MDPETNQRAKQLRLPHIKRIKKKAQSKTSQLRLKNPSNNDIIFKSELKHDLTEVIIINNVLRFENIRFYSHKELIKAWLRKYPDVKKIYLCSVKKCHCLLLVFDNYFLIKNKHQINDEYHLINIEKTKIKLNRFYVRKEVFENPNETPFGHLLNLIVSSDFDKNSNNFYQCYRMIEKSKRKLTGKIPHQMDGYNQDYVTSISSLRSNYTQFKKLFFP